MGEAGMPFRRDLRYKVHIRVECSTREAFVSNHMTNISRGGLFLQGARPFPVDADVLLTFTLPGTEFMIEATGCVIWRHDPTYGARHQAPGCGIRFTGMSLEHRALLNGYLERLTESETGH